MIIPDLVFLVAFVYVVSLFLKKLPAFKAGKALKDAVAK